MARCSLENSLAILSILLAGCAGKNTGQVLDSASDSAVWDSRVPLKDSRPDSHALADAHGDASICTSDHWCKQYVPDYLPYKIWGSGPSDIFIVAGGSGIITHYDGSTWSNTDTGDYKFNSVWGSGPSDVYAVGVSDISTYYQAAALHYNGVTWSPISSLGVYYTYGSNYDTIWGSSASDVYVFGTGENTLLYHFDGSTWNKLTSPWEIQWFYCAWGSGPSDVYAVTYSGNIIHYNGTAWAVTKTQWHLLDIWGASSSDIYAVGFDKGKNGIIIHSDGSTWSTMKSVTSMGFGGVWGSGASDVYAVGSEGTILHYDGSSWSTQDSGVTGYSSKDYFLESVWGSGPNDVYAVGDYSDLLQHDGWILHRAQ
jgi:hypothetical protein